MFLVVLALLLCSMLALLFGMIFFKEEHSKILAANSLGTHVIVFACLYTDLTTDSNSLDVAFIYSLMAFIGLTATVNFIFHKNVWGR